MTTTRPRTEAPYHRARALARLTSFNVFALPFSILFEINTHSWPVLIHTPITDWLVGSRHRVLHHQHRISVVHRSAVVCVYWALSTPDVSKYLSQTDLTSFVYWIYIERVFSYLLSSRAPIQKSSRGHTTTWFPVVVVWSNRLQLRTIDIPWVNAWWSSPRVAFEDNSSPHLTPLRIASKKKKKLSAILMVINLSNIWNEVCSLAKF